MRIAVCDSNASDNAAVCDCIREYCEKNCYSAEILRFESGEALLADFLPDAFQIVLLDVFLSGISGIETARAIRATNLDCALIFVTASPEHALDAYSVGALSYVLKPAKPKGVERALFMCRQEFVKASRIIKIPVSRGNIINIPLTGIQYVEVYGRDSLLHMYTGNVKSRLPLAEIEQMLGGHPFLRCHRCYIVNMNYVSDVRKQEFLMHNGDVVPVRKNGSAKAKLSVAQFMTESACLR